MPSRRFWSMNRQIARIEAANDLREVNIGVALNSENALKEVTERLVLEIGDTQVIEREVIVRGDPNRKAKFAHAMRG